MGLFMAIAVLTMGSARPSACSCIGPIVACESAWTTDAIFVGKVLKIGLATEPAERFVFRIKPVQFAVVEAFKGAEVGELTVTTGLGGGDCGYDFQPNQTYLVYAHRNPQTRVLSAGICSRTASVEGAAEDLAYLRGPFRQPSATGTIQGVVRRIDPGATAEAPRIDTPYAGARVRLKGSNRSWQTVSDIDGRYSFRVPAGDYRLSADDRLAFMRRPTMGR